MYSIQQADTSEMISKVHEVIKESFLTVAQAFNFTRESVPRFPAFIEKEIIEKQISNGLVLFVYVDSGQVIGSVGIKEMDNRLFKIERLAVLPEKRHKSVGAALMKFAEEQISKRGGVYAQVEIVYENMVLKQWYEKQGFVLESIEKYDSIPFQVGVLIKSLSEKNNVLN